MREEIHTDKREDGTIKAVLRRRRRGVGTGGRKGNRRVSFWFGNLTAAAAAGWGVAAAAAAAAAAGR